MAQKLLDPSQQDYEEKFGSDPEHRPGSIDMSDFENRGTVDQGTPAERKAKNQSGGSDIDNLRQGEQSGGNQTWKNTVGGTLLKTKGGPTVFYKRKGPIGAIIALILGGGFGAAAMFGGPSLILVDIYEEVTGSAKINTQLTSMQMRTNSILGSKFSDATSGICGQKITIMCKFTSPSNYQMKQLKKYGITPVDTEGHEIDASKGLWPNKKPYGFKYTNSGGETKIITAPNLQKALAEDPEFARDFNKAYNPRFVSLMDKVFQSIRDKFHFSGQDKEKDEANANDVDKSLDDEATGENESSSSDLENGSSSDESSATEDESEAAKTIENDVETKVDNMTSELGKNIKDDKSAIGVFAGAACVAGDVPGMIVRVVRDYQIAQVVRYASVFLIAAGALKAGDATPTEIAALGGLLTAVVATKTAMDSYGMRSMLLGDSGVGNDKGWLSKVPGVAAMRSNSFMAGMGSLMQFTNSPTVKKTCSIANNPALWTSIDVASSEALGAGILNAVLGVAAGEVITAFAPKIAESVAHIIPASVYSSILGAIAGNMFTGLNKGGEGVGDALASGAENMMSQTANAGGNMPLSVNQAVAYNQVTNQVDLAYAQEDRATLSPLDASNPNTALGSFVKQFMPYYADMTSVSGIFSMISSVVSSSFSTIMSPLISHATDPADQYSQCQDPSIQQSHTAATPFCAIDYGIPPEYLNISPTQVISDLQASGDIDSDGNILQPTSDNPIVSSVFGSPSATGNPPTSLSQFKQECLDGTTDQIIGSSNNCTINSRQMAEYALFFIDNRVESTMDGEDPNLTNGNTDGSNSSDNTDSSSNDTAYNQNSTTKQYIALLDQVNQPMPSARQQPTTELATTTTVPMVIRQFFTNLPSKRASGIVA